MIRGILHRLILLATVLMLAAVSVHSAARMAQGVSLDPAVSVWLASGGSLDDLCGTLGEGDAGQHCPICHKLGKTPEVDFALRQWRLVHSLAYDRTPLDLRLGPQGCNPNVSARAPPSLA